MTRTEAKQHAFPDEERKTMYSGHYEYSDEIIDKIFNYFENYSVELICDKKTFTKPEVESMLSAQANQRTTETCGNCKNYIDYHCTVYDHPMMESMSCALDWSKRDA